MSWNNISSELTLLENQPIPETDLVFLKELESYILEQSPERCFLVNPTATFSYETQKSTFWFSFPKNMNAPLVFLKIDVNSYKEKDGFVVSYVDIAFLAGEQVATYRLERFITWWPGLGVTMEHLNLLKSRFDYVFLPLLKA